MESKQITLRSQTVQCQNCGEYYSVTYKYCPFCEYGKPEERRPGQKNGSGSLFGGLFSGPDGKKKKSAEPKKRHTGEESRRTGAAELKKQDRPETGREESVRTQRSAEAKKSLAGQRKSAESKKRPARQQRETTGEFDRKTAMGGYAEWYSSPEYEATRRRSGSHKKTSEMTEQERAIDRAEREARAAERKRERERMTRAAAMNELNRSIPALVPDEARPQEVPAAPVEQVVEAPVQEPVAEPVPQPVPEEVPVQQIPVPEEVPVQQIPVPEEVSVQQTPAPEEIDPARLENIPLFIPEEQEIVAPVVSEGESTPAPVESEIAQTMPETAVSEAPVSGETVPPVAEMPLQEPVVPVTAEPEKGTPEKDLDTLLREIREMLGEPAVAEPAQSQEMENSDVDSELSAQAYAVSVETAPVAEPVQLEETAPVAEPVQPEKVVTVAEPVQPEETAPVMESVQPEETAPVAEPVQFEEADLTEELTLDQIMNEVKQGLLDMPAGNPVGDYVAQQLVDEEQPAQMQEEAQPDYAEQPAQMQEEAQPTYAEQPAQMQEEVQPTYAEQPAQMQEEAQPVYEEQPAQPYEAAALDTPSDDMENPFLNLDETTAFETAGEYTVPAEEEAAAAALLTAETGKKQKKKRKKKEAEQKNTPVQRKKPEKDKSAQRREPEKGKSNPRKKSAKGKPTGKKKKFPILPLVSLVIIVVAIVIVVKCVVPTFQSGLLSGGQTEAQTEVTADTAESFTLDQTELNFVEPGAKVTLTPIFEPEGSTATLSWACDNWSVAYLDPDGTVTSMAPGDALVVATMANGQTAQCVIHCNWEDGTVSQEAAASAQATRGGVSLVSNDITLSEEGASKTIELVGADSAQWESSNPSVATVDQSGVVTAVAKGSASITAEVGDKTLTCAVRCVW